jgi:hypothetical protein
MTFAQARRTLAGLRCAAPKDFPGGVDQKSVKQYPISAPGRNPQSQYAVWDAMYAD